MKGQLRKARQLAAVTTPIASLVISSSAMATPPSTADIVVYTYALTICLTEEGYATSEQAERMTKELLEGYSRQYEVGIDRLYRITQLSDFRDRIVEMIKGIGGCKALLDKRSRTSSI